jgi:hypothetical protein
VDTGLSSPHGLDSWNNRTWIASAHKVSDLETFDIGAGFHNFGDGGITGDEREILLCRIMAAQHTQLGSRRNESENGFTDNFTGSAGRKLQLPDTDLVYILKNNRVYFSMHDLNPFFLVFLF